MFKLKLAKSLDLNSTQAGLGWSNISQLWLCIGVPLQWENTHVWVLLLESVELEKFEYELNIIELFFN